MGTTNKMGIPYPENTDFVADGATNMKDIADEVDAKTGLIFITSGSLSSTATNFDGVFTDDYDNYRIVIDSVSFSGTGDIYFQFRNGSTTITGSDYNWALSGVNTSGSATNNGNANQQFAYTGLSNTGANGVAIAAGVIDLYGPKKAQRSFATVVASRYVSLFTGVSGMFEHNLTTAYDGFRLSTLGPNITGNVRIYGYNQ